MKWSDWKEINKLCNDFSYAVYQIKLVSRFGKESTIKRFLGIDKKGTLLIGMTTNMERRRKQFISGKENHIGHSEGELLYILTKYSKLRIKHKKPKYHYRFLRVNSKNKAQKLEEKLIKAYVKRYGEVPPLNTTIPNRSNLISWERV